VAANARKAKKQASSTGVVFIPIACRQRAEDVLARRTASKKEGKDSKWKN
jgi:hypothetical protein